MAVAWGLLAFHSEEYVLTTRRLIHAEGVINKRASDVSLDRITDAVLTEPFLGRLLGYGDLRILTAGAANERLRQLRQPTAFRQALFEARHELELERARPTMPPIRIAPPGGAAAPSIAPPPPPSAPAMTQGEVVAGALAARGATGGRGDRRRDLRPRPPGPAVAAVTRQFRGPDDPAGTIRTTP